MLVQFKIYKWFLKWCVNLAQPLCRICGGPTIGWVWSYMYFRLADANYSRVIVQFDRLYSWADGSVGPYVQLSDFTVGPYVLWAEYTCTVRLIVHVQLGWLYMYSWTDCTVGQVGQFGQYTVGPILQLGRLYSWAICTVGLNIHVQLGWLYMYSWTDCTVGQVDSLAGIQFGRFYSLADCESGAIVQTGWFYSLGGNIMFVQYNLLTL